MEVAVMHGGRRPEAWRTLCTFKVRRQLSFIVKFYRLSCLLDLVQIPFDDCKLCNSGRSFLWYL